MPGPGVVGPVSLPENALGDDSKKSRLVRVQTLVLGHGRHFVIYNFNDFDHLGRREKDKTKKIKNTAQYLTTPVGENRLVTKHILGEEN